jgi:hypothetical protein
LFRVQWSAREFTSGEFISVQNREFALVELDVG